MNICISDTRLRTAALATVVALLTVSTAGPATAQPPIPVRYSTRAQAMGGAMLLSAGPIEAGYFNPGALTQSRGLHLYIPMLQFATDGDYLDLANFMIDNSQNFTPAGFLALSVQERDQFLDDLDKYAGKWQTLNLDPMIGLQIGSLSFSAYSVARLNMKPDVTGVPLNPPTVGAQIFSDLVLNGALGMQIGPLLHGGIGIRYLRRERTGVVNINPQDMGDLRDLTYKLVDKDNFIGDPLSSFQVDVGGMFTLTKAFAVGGVIRGLISSSDIPGVGWEPEICAGVRLKPLDLLMGIPLVIIRDITLEADIRDVANVSGEEYTEKLQLGAEVKLPFFALRAGLDHGQTSLGAAFHFLIVDLSAAVSTITDWTPIGPIEKRYFSVAVGIGW